MRVVITGATGLLGRNVVFELVKEHAGRLDTLEVVILGRDAPGAPLADRVREMFDSDGRYYLRDASLAAGTLDTFLAERVRSIPCDLRSPSRDLPALVGPDPIDCVIHSAAALDFREGAGPERVRQETNVAGTAAMLALAEQLRPRRFVYIGSAYACGRLAGVIPPDADGFSAGFRNPYERSKQEAETLVRAFEHKTGIPCFYFRPSTISGRLLEPLVGMTPKFDVFYAWAAFFLRLKQKMLRPGQDLYATPLELPLRVRFRRDTGLNIVPVDYAAKAMCWALRLDEPGSYHLANDAETPHTLYIPLMLEALNLHGPVQVDAVPEHLTSLEDLYYRTVGSAYTPYVANDPLLFDVRNLEKIHQAGGFSCPAVDAARFKGLMAYAIDRHFGFMDARAAA